MSRLWILLSLAFWIGTKALAQQPDSLAIVSETGAILLQERDIVSWEWGSQAVVLSNSGKAFLESKTIDCTTWRLMLGDRIVYGGFFLHSEPIERATDSIFLDLDLQIHRVRVPYYNQLILWYFPHGNVHRRNRDWRLNPLYNPILLDHLVARNLIPAEYRLRLLFRAIGLPWPGKR